MNSLTKRKSLTAFISSVTPEHWSLNDEKETRVIKTFDSTRLDSAGVYALPRLCESDWSGLDSTLLVFTHPKRVELLLIPVWIYVFAHFSGSIISIT
jgi:hypothetical protein